MASEFGWAYLEVGNTLVIITHHYSLLHKATGGHHKVLFLTENEREQNKMWEKGFSTTLKTKQQARVAQQTT